MAFTREQKYHYNGSKTIKVSDDLRIQFKGFDWRLKTTKQLAEVVESIVKFAASRLVLPRTVVVIENAEQFKDLSDKTISTGFYTAQKVSSIAFHRATVAGRREYAKLARTIFHELGHAESEKRFPGACSKDNWSSVEKENYANMIMLACMLDFIQTGVVTSTETAERQYYTERLAQNPHYARREAELKARQRQQVMQKR